MERVARYCYPFSTPCIVVNGIVHNHIFTTEGPFFVRMLILYILSSIILYHRTGLHLNLTEGHPVSAPGDVSTLLNSDGMFRGMMGTREALSRGILDSNEVQCRFPGETVLCS